MTVNERIGHHRRLFFRLSIIFITFQCLVIPFVQADDKLVTVGVYENAPKIFITESGEPSGIFIDIIKHIADTEGWNLPVRIFR